MIESATCEPEREWPEYAARIEAEESGPDMTADDRYETETEN